VKQKPFDLLTILWNLLVKQKSFDLLTILWNPPVKQKSFDLLTIRRNLLVKQKSFDLLTNLWNPQWNRNPLIYLQSDEILRCWTFNKIKWLFFALCNCDIIQNCCS
jgi:hypothetical protein